MTKKAEAVEPVRSKSKELLDALDEAFETAEAKQAELQKRRKTAETAIAKQEDALNALKAEHNGLIAEADAQYQDARIALDRLRESLNERIGSITGVGSNPRVTISS